MVDLGPQHIFDGVHHPLTARCQAIDAVTRLVPQRNPCRLALSVAALVEALFERRVLLHGLAHEADLFSVEKRRDQHKAVRFIGLTLGGCKHGGHWIS